MHVMRFISPASLAVLLTIPVIVAIYIRHRRLPVRQVAGLFLWLDPAKSAQQAHDLSGWSRSTLIRDVLAVVGLAFVAHGLFTADVTDASERTQWLVVGGRTLVCVAIAALLWANWRQSRRS